MKAILLIVDDNLGDRELVRQALNELGSAVEIMEAADGDDALELLETLMREQKLLPDIILLDLNLARLSGSSSLPGTSGRSGGFPYGTTASASTLSMRTRSLTSSSGCIAVRSIPAPASVWRSASESWRATAAGSGWSRRPARGPRFILPWDSFLETD